MADKLFVGRRKNAVARVYLRNGSGKITINDSEAEKYFPLREHRNNLLLPFIATETQASMTYLLMLLEAVFQVSPMQFVSASQERSKKLILNLELL